jgi:hypothetical protein
LLLLLVMLGMLLGMLEMQQLLLVVMVLGMCDRDVADT